MLWPAFITILVFGWFLYSIMKSGNNDEKFRKEGIKVEAKIISKQHISTSGTGNMKLDFEFEFEFMIPDGVVVTYARRFITPEEMVKIGRKIQFVYITSPVPLKKSTLFLEIWSKLLMIVFVNSTDATL
ncbi:hypothetical protein [Klebsiella aerogenes]|uniref:hypothetical protein n=1 Tax=Klebsiella aerogenes TaxID=548 RepID=UPI0005068FFA|nr:hypothetical protein [Klebsiella aerogenes]KGB08301.1 hypothetical protein DR72_3464 [Klebsiella aerogenes]